MAKKKDNTAMWWIGGGIIAAGLFWWWWSSHSSSSSNLVQPAPSGSASTSPGATAPTLARGAASVAPTVLDTGTTYGPTDVTEIATLPVYTGGGKGPPVQPRG